MDNSNTEIGRLRAEIEKHEQEITEVLEKAARMELRAAEVKAEAARRLEQTERRLSDCRLAVLNGEAELGALMNLQAERDRLMAFFADAHLLDLAVKRQQREPKDLGRRLSEARKKLAKLEADADT